MTKIFLVLFFLISASFPGMIPKENYEKEAIDFLKKEVINQAERYLKEEPQTITIYICPRSSGGVHDFYSEGDYWWPDPVNPEGPYIQRDGMTNPENFTDHRKAVIRLSMIVGTLASAYKITGDEKYVRHAFAHLKAWFADPLTRMNPSLLYSQAIKGRFSGRGIGIIDTVHLIDVAKGIIIMEGSDCVEKELLVTIKSWFAEYLQWLLTHKYGIDEMNASNNHGTCWVMQAASFARLTLNEEVLELCRKRYKEILLPGQMAVDGSFPLEINRTKPYGYSLFNLDAMTMICLILSDNKNDLWNYTTPDGKSIGKGIEFMYPYVADKDRWPFRKDVMFWDEWPVAQPFLLFGSLQFSEKNWYETWQTLGHYPETDEIIRNLPVKNPVIWFN